MFYTSSRKPNAGKLVLGGALCAACCTDAEAEALRLLLIGRKVCHLCDATLCDGSIVNLLSAPPVFADGPRAFDAASYQAVFEDTPQGFLTVQYTQAEAQAAHDLHLALQTRIARSIFDADEAIRRIDSEGDLMAHARRDSEADGEGGAAGALWQSLGAEDVRDEPGGAVDALRADGVVRIRSVLPLDCASELLAHVNASLQAALDTTRDDPTLASEHFGAVLNRRFRWDLKLDLCAPVCRAMRAALDALRPTLVGTLGEDAELVELAALVSDPHATRQPVHPDTAFTPGEHAPILTAFLALQAVDERMGPTVFLPRTHTADAHTAFSDEAGKASLLQQTPHGVALLNEGDAAVFDSRLLHCGGGNESRKRRVLFYFSFRSRASDVRRTADSMLEELRGKHFLSNHDEWLA